MYVTVNRLHDKIKIRKKVYNVLLAIVYLMLVYLP